MKKIIAFALTLIMVLSLVACGNDTVRDGKIETSGPNENQTTLKRYYPNCLSPAGAQTKQMQIPTKWSCLD